MKSSSSYIFFINWWETARVEESSILVKVYTLTASMLSDLIQIKQCDWRWSIQALAPAGSTGEKGRWGYVVSL